jgi:hypothetical protein
MNKSFNKVQLKTLIVDDIDLDKITKFVAKTRKEEQVYKIITIIALINGAIAAVPGKKCWALEDEIGAVSKELGISIFVQSHDVDQFEGLQKPIKGKVFEILENTHENNDGDQYQSEIYDTPNHPMVDLKITDSLTGKSYGVQLKASENINYIEETLRKYPDTPIIVPKGVAEKVNHPLVMDGNYTSEKINEINDSNFDKILDVQHGEFLAKGGLEAGSIILAVNLMPFIYARQKGQINNEQFSTALKKFIPEITAKTIHRVTLLSLIGPLYAFFLISKTIGKSLLDGIDEEDIEVKDEKEYSFNKKNMSRREFFLLFKPKNI